MQSELNCIRIKSVFVQHNEGPQSPLDIRWLNLSRVELEGQQDDREKAKVTIQAVREMGWTPREVVGTLHNWKNMASHWRETWKGLRQGWQGGGMETKCDNAQETELKEERRKGSLILKSMNLRGQQDRCVHRVTGWNERLITWLISHLSLSKRISNDSNTWIQTIIWKDVSSYKSASGLNS